MSLLECCVEIDRGKIDASRVGNSKCTIRRQCSGHMSLLECCVGIDRGKIDASRVGNSKCTIRNNIVVDT